ncbi:MAG: glycosyltransferase family 4 protein [Acidobacteriota bacterium]
MIPYSPMPESPSSTPTALFWSYDRQVPSFRLRLEPVIEELRRRGWRCETEILPRGRYLRRIVERRAALKAADLLVIAKLNLAPGEGPLLRRWARRVAFDFDDAIYLRKPKRIGQAPDRSWMRRHKFLTTCRAADLILAGNRELARATGAAAERLAITPTAVEVTRYPSKAPPNRQPRTLVWIGLPENLLYLEPFRPVFERLAREMPDVKLRIVSSEAPSWPEVPIEFVPWSLEGEVEALTTAGVGLMPLADDAWTRGKCAFKLLQYMAAGLPCVASPVGANLEVVVPGKTGYLPRTSEEWWFALKTLLDDRAHAQVLGWTGRRQVESRYDRERIAPRAADRLEALVSPTFSPTS